MEKSSEKFYYILAGNPDSWKDAESQRLLKLINDGIPASGRLLEVGCGTGNITSHLRSDIKYDGIDLSEFAVTEARKMNSSSNVHFEVSSASNIPFPSSSFDFVLVLQVLASCTNPEAVLRETKRVLKPGGKVLLIDANFDFPLSLPSTLRHRSFVYRIYFRLLRMHDYFCRILGVETFRTIKFNFTDATGRYEQALDDIHYMVSAAEVIGFLTKNGFRIEYLEKEPQKTGPKQAVKKLISYLPGMQYFGRGLYVILSLDKS